MIDQKDAVTLGSKLPKKSTPNFQHIDANSEGLEAIQGPKEMVVMIDPKDPKAILNHPVLGPILKPHEQAIFTERFDAGGKAAATVLRTGKTPCTIAVQNAGSLQLIHIINGGPTVGNPNDDNYTVPKQWRDTAAQLHDVVGDLNQAGQDSLAIFLDGKVLDGNQSGEIIRALGIGLGNIAYEVDNFRAAKSEVFVDGKAPEALEGGEATPEEATKSIRNAISNVLFVSDIELDDQRKEGLVSHFEDGDTVSRVQSLVKFLAECPHNIMTCEVFVRTIVKLYEEVKAMGNNVEMEIYGPEGVNEGNNGITLTNSLDSQGLNMLKAVHQGSASEVGPFMVRIKYRPERAQGKKVHLMAGKTMVFDSGGTVPKGKAEEEMQADMMGGASVAAEFARMGEETTPRNMDFVFAVASNKIDGDARNIEDTFTLSSGLTTEEKHPDAEGRQVLADVIGAGLKLAHRQGDEVLCVTSVATLTGAAILMGGHRALIVSDSKKVRRWLEDTSQANGDRFEGMHLDSEDAGAVRKTKRADVRNHAPEGMVPGQRGSQTAAAYIREASGIKDIPFTHIDMASGLGKHAGTPKDVQGEMGADGYLATLHEFALAAPNLFPENKAA